MKISATVYLLLCIAGCAVQQYPNGGPKDSVPPSVIGSSVQSGTVGFSGSEIEFEFSEYMDKNSVKNALFISPSVHNKYDLRWDGRFVRLVFKEKLIQDVTYVFTIGSAATDRRGGNNLVQAFQLAVSTGSVIDTMSIRGNVFDSKTLFGSAGATILAYNLLNNPNPNPEKDAADYFTQSGADGSFLLGYMKNSTYRVFAIRETYKNEIWEKSEPIGVGMISEIQSQHKPDSVYSFYLSESDIESPKISGVVAENVNLLKVTFSENFSAESSSPVFRLKNETSEIRILESINSILSNNQVFLATDSLSDGNYTLVQYGISDAALNISVPDTFSFAVFTKDIKYKTRIQTFPPDTNRVLGIAEKLNVLYSSSRKIDSVRFFQKLTKSGKWKKTDQVVFSNDDRLLHTIQLQKSWETESNYKGFVFSGKDTLQFGFRTYSDSEKGALSGYFVYIQESVTTYVELLSTDDQKTYKTAAKNNKFIFAELPAGKYTLTAYSDINNNRKWDSGSPFPWTKSEPKYFTADTIKIRARWTLEDVKMEQR